MFFLIKPVRFRSPCLTKKKILSTFHEIQFSVKFYFIYNNEGVWYLSPFNQRSLYNVFFAQRSHDYID